jgi:hypothetical protein
MQEFKDKYQYKNHIRKIAADLGFDEDMFDKIFANVFLEIFEKEQQIPCIFKKYHIGLTNQMLADIKTIKKVNKENFLILFEDYQKINNELNEIVLKIQKDCEKKSFKCSDISECDIDIKKYPLFFGFSQRKDLQVFRPDLITSPELLQFIEDNMGKPGLCFLYNLNRELLFITKGSNIGAKIIDAIWDKNPDGYVAVALTKKIADIHIYEPYYIIKEKPILISDMGKSQDFSFELEPLKKSDLVKIYENN